ncbi:hypothetical protein HYQ44_017141 [Verticillium longisporum]|nr:hypothetical protein HYQ44_017141 [Verticillium longisporum]
MMAYTKSVDELQELLRQAEQRAADAERDRQQERQRAEREQQRAEREQQRAEREQQRAEKEQLRAEDAEEQTRPTTFIEYIVACHIHVFLKLVVETDKKLTSKGSITNPRNKWCPTHLRPWPDFLEQQRVIFGKLHDSFPTNSRLFESRGFLAGLGYRISQRPIANEKTLEYFLHNSVEDPVRTISEQLKQVESVRRAFDMGRGIVFENHPHAISDVAQEVADRQTPSTPQTPDHRHDLNQLRPDQICVYRSNDGPLESRTMVFVSEYKPPHKLTTPHLRLGLRAMNIPNDVVNRKTIPTSAAPDALFQYHAERLTASAVTQTYHYMIEGGLEYGLLTTGEAFVFLKVDWEEPETLYYHLAEPGPEVAAHPEHSHVCTAVGQYLAFSLLALGSPGQRRIHGQEQRRRVTLGLRTWAQDFEMTLRSIPESERSLSSGSSGYKPTTYEGFDRSPHARRWKRHRASRGDQVDRGTLRRDQSESSDDELTPNPPDTPTPMETRSRRRRRQETESNQDAISRQPQGGGEKGRVYCTQKCLLGLVRSGFLDRDCPNIALHTGQDLNHAEWLQLLRKQLEQSLDDGIRPLYVSGARGVLFQVTMIAYGYTFVGKGTVQAFIRDLEHEAAVYERLRSIQGVNVPVFLGAIDLRPMTKIYYYDHRVFEKMAVRSLQAVHEHGVVHNDVRVANMLVNLEMNGVMMIDFERASLLTLPRHPLAQLVPNKRTGNQEAVANVASKDTRKTSM